MAVKVGVKREILESSAPAKQKQGDDVLKKIIPLIDLSSSSESESSSDSELESDEDDNEGNDGVGRAGNASGPPKKKRKKLGDIGVLLPVGFLRPLPPPELQREAPNDKAVSVGSLSCKQFWKAGDDDGAPSGDWDFSSGNFFKRTKN